MSGQILKFDDSAHRDADELLPWFVNGTLEGDELAMVEQHVRDCARCRREVVLLQQIRATCAMEEPMADAASSYRRLSERIGGTRWSDAFGDRWVGMLGPWRQAPGWARWAIAAEFAAMVALAVPMFMPGVEPPALYQTLGATPARAPVATIAVVFVPEVTESELRRIVRKAGARVVDGPTEGNAYLLQVTADHREAVLAALQSERGVVLAQPLSAKPDR